MWFDEVRAAVAHVQEQRHLGEQTTQFELLLEEEQLHLLGGVVEAVVVQADLANGAELGVAGVVAHEGVELAELGLGKRRIGDVEARVELWVVGRVVNGGVGVGEDKLVHTARVDAQGVVETRVRGVEAGGERDGLLGLVDRGAGEEHSVDTGLLRAPQDALDVGLVVLFAVVEALVHGVREIETDVIELDGVGHPPEHAAGSKSLSILPFSPRNLCTKVYPLFSALSWWVRQ